MTAMQLQWSFRPFEAAAADESPIGPMSTSPTSATDLASRESSWLSRAVGIEILRRAAGTTPTAAGGHA